MPLIPQRQVIIAQTEQNLICSVPALNVRFDVQRFNNAIETKGYRVTHEKALKCSCIDPTNNSPLPDCTNCAGIGYFYVEKTLTKAIVQSMGNDKKYEAWSETNKGKANITTKYTEQVTYMDRFTMLDLELNFNQIVRMRTKTGRIFGFTIYFPYSVYEAYAFNGSDNPLRHLINQANDPVNWDYFIDLNRVELNPTKFTFTEDLIISIRYQTRPVYYIVDIKRELFKTQTGDCCDLVGVECEAGGGDLTGMPQLSVGQRAHYMWDAPTLTGTITNDNTVYTKYEPSALVVDDFPTGNLLDD